MSYPPHRWPITFVSLFTNHRNNDREKALV